MRIKLIPQRIKFHSNASNSEVHFAPIHVCIGFENYNGYISDFLLLNFASFLIVCSNGLNFFFKLLAWVYTGSASMFSEAIHSLADTCNQALLALGISQSVRNPDAGHP